MKELSGIRADTPKNLLFGPGKGYFNIDLAPLRDAMDADPVGNAILAATLIGATRGGFEFNLEPEIREIEVDGSRGLVKGMRRLLAVQASITVNFAELTVANLLKMIPGADSTDQGNGFTEITGGELANSDYISNVAFLCTHGDRADPAVLVIENALADGGLSLSLDDNDEGTPAVTFQAHYDPASPDTQPWAIFIADAA